jgi:TolA-binding protein
MTRLTGNKYHYNRATPEKFAGSYSDSVHPYHSDDSVLWESISEFMKGHLDAEDVRLDTRLPEIEIIVKEMISDYHNKGIINKADEKFIRDNFHEIIPDKELQDEINDIRVELSNSNINEITASLVENWQERKEASSGNDPESGEIREFILSSLEAESREPEIHLTNKGKKGLNKYLIRYISLSAAAIISVVILIKALLPAYNPDKLFNAYYEPFSAVLPVSRSVSTDESDTYSAGIEKYKMGDYQHAADDFSNYMLNNSLSTGASYFSGITQMALGNYNKAIKFLEEVASQSGEYRKDAEWYLGLAYMKTGKKEKASACFDILSRTSGFYRDRADKILRLLR